MNQPLTAPHQNAFPMTIYDNEIPVGQSHGLTKREFFAVMTLNGYIASQEGLILTQEDIQDAVRLADNLIAALNHEEF